VCPLQDSCCSDLSSRTSIFPYAWKLVQHYHVGGNNAATYAGILIASFALAEALTSYLWGVASDKYGRKPVLLFGCCGSIVSLLIVGFADSFWLALLGRSIGGLLNGNQGVVQTMVAELVTNPEHEARAYAVMPFVWSVGTMLVRDLMISGTMMSLLLTIFAGTCYWRLPLLQIL